MSSYTGSLFTLTLTCTPTESETLIELIPAGESPAGANGSRYGDAVSVDVVPKVNDLTIRCVASTTDSDADGCADLTEVGGDETLGGLRDPENEWDFYDVSGITAAQPDGFIDLLHDVLAVIDHFAPTGQEPVYDAHYDRGPSSGPNAWNLTGPDGKIDLLIDILVVIAQFGHDCR